jgi:hypothetical protein
MHSDQASGAHQPGDALAATASPEAGELAVDAWRAGGAARPVVDLTNDLR